MYFLLLKKNKFYYYIYIKYLLNIRMNQHGRGAIRFLLQIFERTSSHLSPIIWFGF